MTKQLAAVKNPAGIKVFAERLRVLRMGKQFSQKELADLSNLERSTISRFERGLLAPSLDTLISISRVLGTEVRELVDDPAITYSDDGK